MTFDLDIVADDTLDIYIKQIPFAVSKTINDLNRVSKEEETKELIDKVQDPTSFTKKAIRYKQAKKRLLVGSIFVQENRDYLKYLYEGGTERPRRKYLRGVTKHTKVNKFGNITKSTTKRYITNKKKFFKSKAKRGNTYGIWERYDKNTKIRMVLDFAKSWSYKREIRFGDKTKSIYQRNLSRKFGQNITYAIATAR